LSPRAFALGGLATLMVVAASASSASAEPSTYCVKATKVLTPKKHFTGGFNDKAARAPTRRTKANSKNWPRSRLPKKNN
jgi:hypothetical protein